MIASKNISNYRDILHDFAEEQGFEASIPQISTKVVPEEHEGDGSFHPGSDELTVQVALDGPNHQLAEGIYRDVELIDKRAGQVLVHEYTHKEFAYQHPEHSSRNQVLDNSEDLQRAEEEVGEKFIEEHQDLDGEMI